jgi:hypothetical protein
MRFPSLFRLPNHQQFVYKPRYYDPIKEDIAIRKERIKRELERRKRNEEGTATDDDHKYAISEAFARRRKRNSSAGLLQFFMMVLFMSTAFGYIYFGNDALYILISLLPVYLLVRLKNLY